MQALLKSVKIPVITLLRRNGNERQKIYITCNVYRSAVLHSVRLRRTDEER